jgi:segregation and condensation protein A
VIYQVELLNFNGPLDLLLQLIERNRLEVTDISLAEVTAQYLSYINQLTDLEPAQLNWFIDLAAKLILLKSQALVPAKLPEGAEEELAELEHQLAEFAQYQKASQYLQDLLTSCRSWERPALAQPPRADLPPPQMTVDQLTKALESRLSQIPPPSSETPSRPAITLEQMITHLQKRLSGSPANLQSLISENHSRVEIIVLFLALLELVKNGRLSARQDTQFEDIQLAYAG